MTNLLSQARNLSRGMGLLVLERPHNIFFTWVKPYHSAIHINRNYTNGGSFYV